MSKIKRFVQERLFSHPVERRGESQSPDAGRPPLVVARVETGGLNDVLELAEMAIDNPHTPSHIKQEIASCIRNGQWKEVISLVAEARARGILVAAEEGSEPTRGPRRVVGELIFPPRSFERS